MDHAQAIEINCATGEVTTRPLTVAEVQERQAWQAEQAAEEQAAQDAKARRDADRALIAERASADPVFAALARHLGVEV